MASHRKPTIIMLLCIGLFVPSHPLSATAQSVEQFYRGKRIKLIVGSGGGGGYDAFAGDK
jgi:hypothetical protein